MFAVLKEERVKREKTASPASRETWVSRVTGESSDQPDPEERTVPKDQRVARVSQEMLVLLDQTGRRVNSESPDCQDTQEDKDQRDLRVSKVSLAPTERKELGERQESLAHADSEDRRALGEREDREDRQEKLDQRATQGTTAHQDLRERGVCQALRDQLVSPDQRALLDLLEKTGCPDIPDREERLDSKARPAPLVLQAWSDLRVQQVRPDQWEIEATPDPRAHLASKVYPELRGRKEPRVTPDPRAQQVKTVLPVLEVSPEREVCPALWGLTA